MRRIPVLNLSGRNRRDLRQHTKVIALTVLIGSCLIGLIAAWTRESQNRTWRNLQNAAQHAYAQENFPSAKIDYAKCVRFAKDNFGEGDPRYTSALEHLAWVSGSSEDYAAARDIYARIYKLSSEDLTRVRLAQTSLSFVDMVSIYENSKGAGALTIAVESLGKYLGPNDPELIPLLKRLAFVYEQDGKFTEAETQCRRILSIHNETEGPSSVGVATAHSLMGDCYSKWGASESNVSPSSTNAKEYCLMARKEFGAAIDMYEKVLGSNAPQIATVRNAINEIGKPPRPTVVPSLEKDPIPQL
jgi:tetratricopeptide (TPR) repeat protein